ncbi:hypothetical protein K7432_016698 [Basidiobolus ranarum]|uniref:Uncharacterized protein n=1 Tax=Basidiobolus ranarum TaxID=34480 RepID=A0ABR2VLJ8_9FUNG
MYFSSIKLLFSLSSASVIAGVSFAERDYSPSHHSSQYAVNKEWDNREHPGWRSEKDEYANLQENNDYRRHNDYNHDDDQDYDINHDDYERGGNRYEDRHGRYRMDSRHAEEYWDYDSEVSRKGRNRYFDDNDPSGEDINGGNGSSNSGSPAEDGDTPTSQENADPASGNGSGETTGSKEATKPENSPTGDGTNIHQDDDCHRNLVDGRLNVLDIKAKVCLGLDLAGNILNNDRDTSSLGAPSGLTEGLPGGVPSGKSNGLPGNSAGDSIPNGSNIPKSPGAPAGDTDSLPSGTPGASSSLDNLDSPLNESSSIVGNQC